MFFTVINNCIILILALVINLLHNTSFDFQLETFNNHFFLIKGIFLGAEKDKVTQFCERDLESMISETHALAFFNFFIILTSIGSFTSFFQKFLTFRFKDNVKLSPGQMLLEISMGITGLLFFFNYNSSNVNTMMSDHCRNYIDMDDGDIYVMDHVYTLRDPTSGGINLIVSIIIIQASVSLILMLKRT